MLAPSAPVFAAEATDQVTIVLTGDTGFNRNGYPAEAGGVRRIGFQAWDDTTTLIADDINGDLNFTNIETVVTDNNALLPDAKEQVSPFNFRTHPNGLRHLALRGFNLLSLANNHSMDYGIEGLRDTLQYARALKAERRAVSAGLGMNREEASRPVRVNVKGVQVAFAAIGIVTNNLERHRAGPKRPGQIAYRFNDDFAEVLTRLADTPAAYRILSIHYGEEGKVRADARQLGEWRGLAARQSGIDLIVGHHAHVVRGVELVGGSLIFYGLGNFLHHGTADITRKDICRNYGLMARVHLQRGEEGRLSVRAVEAIPVTDTHYRPRRLAAEQSAARIHALNYLAATLDGGGARGMRFTPQRDGSGLFCLARAHSDGGRIGALCRNFAPAPPIPDELRDQIAASCAR